jgi:hypothetical protein
MTLDYNTFKANAANVTGILGGLSNKIKGMAGLNTNSLSKSLDGVAPSASNAERGMEALSRQTERTRGMFDVFSTVATGALLKLGSLAAEKGLQVIKAFTLDPIVGGFKEYELKLGSVQTIMTNTGESVEVVNKKLDELNVYSDKTIYSFNDMTKAIGSLSTSGMALDDASSAVMGFYNLAAGVGVEAGRAGVLLDTAMVQAIQLGKMDYQNWKQLQSSGMGGPKFRDALIANAEALGKNVDLSDGFNASLKDGWATTDVMLATLKQFEKDESLLAAATQVLSFSKLMDTAKESVESGWAETWEIVFGNFNESKAMWTNVWNAMEPIIEGSSNLRNNFIRAFKDNGGIKAIFNTFGNIWNLVTRISTAINTGLNKALGNTGKAIVSLGGVFAIPFKMIELLTRKISEFKLIPGVIQVAFTVLGYAIKGVVTVIMGVVKTVQFFFNLINTGITKFSGWIKSLPWKHIIDPLKEIQKIIKVDLFGKLFSDIKQLKDGALDKIATMFRRIADSLGILNKNVKGEIWTPFVQVMTKLASGLIERVGKAIGLLIKPLQTLTWILHNFVFKPLLNGLSILASGIIYTVSGALQVLANALGFVMKLIMSFIVTPLVKALFDVYLAIEGSVLKAIDKLDKKLTKLKQLFNTFVVTPFVKQVERLNDWFNRLRQSVDKMNFGPLRNSYDSLRRSFSVNFFDPLAKAIKALPGPVTLLKDAFGGLEKLKTKDWFVAVKKSLEGIKFDGIKQGFIGIGTVAKAMFHTFYDLEPLRQAREMMGSFVDKAKGLANPVIKQGLDLLSYGFLNLQKIFPNVNFQPMLDGITKVKLELDKMLASISFEGVKKLFDNLKKTIIDFSSSIDFSGFNAITKPITNFKNQLVEAIKALDFSSLSGISKSLDVFKNQVVATFKSLDFSNLDTLKQPFIMLKDSIMEALSGIDFGPLGTKVQAAGILIKTALDTIGLFFSGIGVDVGKFVETIQNGVRIAATALGDFAKDAWARILRGEFKTITVDAATFGETMNSVGSKATEAMQAMWRGIKIVISGIGDGFRMLGSAIKEVAQTIVTFIKWTWDQIKAFGPNIANWSATVKEKFGDALSTENLVKGGLAVYLATILKSMFTFQQKGGKLMDSITDMFGGFPDLFGGITDALANFNKMVTPGNILKVSVALVLMAGAIKLMSTVNSEDLVKTLIILASSVGALSVAMFAMNKTAANPAKMAAATGAIMGISTAILILSGALKVMSTIEPESLKYSLQAVFVTMGGLTAMIVAIGKLAPNINIAVSGVIGMTTSLLILATAIKAFADIPTDDLVKGGVAAGLALAALTLSLKALGNVKFGIGTGIAILAVAQSLNVVAKAVAAFGQLDGATLAKGLIGVGIALAGITASLKVLDGAKTMMSATAIAVVAMSLSALVIPIGTLGSMQLSTLAKGIGSVTIVLAGITAALAVLGTVGVGSLAGAAAIALVAASLNTLIIPITVLGTMKWQTLAQGLLGLAGGLTVMLAAAAVATVVAPGLAILATALVALGAAAVGIGLAVSGVIKALDWLTNSTKDSFDRLLDNMSYMMRRVSDMVPEFVSFAVTMVGGFLQVLVEATPKIASAGADIIIAILGVMAEKIPAFAQNAADLIIAWLKAFGEHAPRMLQAAAETLIELINGMADVLKNNAEPLVQAVLNLVGAVIQTIVIALGEVLKVLVGWIPGAEAAIDSGMDSVLGIIEERFNPEGLESTAAAGMAGFNRGISGNTEGGKVAAGEVVDGVIGTFDIMDAFTPGDTKGQEFVDGVAKHAPNANTAGQQVSDQTVEGLYNQDGTQPGDKLGTDFFTGVAQQTGNAGNAGQQVSDKAMEGLNNTNGIAPGAKVALDFGSGIRTNGSVSSNAADSISNTAVNNLDADSWSAGENFGYGFGNGIGNTSGYVGSAAAGLGSLAVSWLNSAIDAHSPSRIATTSGGWFGEGFGNGIRNMAGMVKDSTATIANVAISEIYDAAGEVDKISFKMMEDFEANPVIKPKLDMSDVDMSEFSRTIRPFVLPTDTPDKGGTPKPTAPAPVFNLTMQANNDLPRSTIFRMAGDFQDAMQEIADTEKFNLGGYA